jgi:hypothetical protein
LQGTDLADVTAAGVDFSQSSDPTGFQLN